MIHLGTIIINLIVLALAVVSLTYIQKLERIGCPCAEHPYRNYIKAWLYVAVVVFLAILLINLGLASGVKLGKNVAMALGVFYMLFGLATFVFYVLAVMYVRYLMNEKCKCSEDTRRTVLYWWSIIELVLIVFSFLVGLLLSISGGLLAFVVGAINPKSFMEVSKHVMYSTVNPLESAKKLSGNMGRHFRTIKKMGK